MSKIDAREHSSCALTYRGIETIIGIILARLVSTIEDLNLLLEEGFACRMLQVARVANHVKDRLHSNQYMVLAALDMAKLCDAGFLLLLQSILVDRLFEVRAGSVI